MAIRFTENGREYVADTPEEVLRLRQLFDSSAREFKKDGIDDPSKRQSRGWTKEKCRTLLNSLGEQQKRLLICIQLRATINMHEMAQALQLPSQEALAGVVSGLSKQLEKIGTRPAQVFFVETRWVGKKKERWFSLVPGFAEATSNLKSITEDVKLAKLFQEMGARLRLCEMETLREIKKSERSVTARSIGESAKRAEEMREEIIRLQEHSEQHAGATEEFAQCGTCNSLHSKEVEYERFLIKWGPIWARVLWSPPKE
ncbi:MAG TPA: hypothetical protein VF133_08040 [Terriglobales bacterium]